MIGAAALAQVTNLPGWITAALAIVTMASPLCRRRLPRPLVWTAFTLSASGLVTTRVAAMWAIPGSAAQGIALTCAVFAFVSSASAAMGSSRRGTAPPEPKRVWSVVGTAHVVALLLGVVTAIVQSVVLTMRVIYVSLDIVNGYPFGAVPAYGFGSEGLWSLGFLFAACAISFVSTGDRRLGTCQFWSAVMMSSWVCLLMPALQSAPAGGYRRTSVTLVLLTTISILLILTVVVTRMADRWQSIASRDVSAASSHRPWPGLPISAAVVALAVMLMVCYHLSVPVALEVGGYRLVGLITTGSAALAAGAGFLLAARAWNIYLVEVAMGLASLALCGLATLVVPSEPRALADRYPLVFNAMMIGLAVATGLWTYLASVWEQRAKADQTVDIAARLAPFARRFAFSSAALALVLGAVMAIWPRWPTVSASDDTLGRVTAGLAANLFLLLVMLWCSRRLHKVTFQILTVLTVVSAGAFLAARMMPFTPRYG